MQVIRQHLVLVSLLFTPVFYVACTQSATPARGERTPLTGATADGGSHKSEPSEASVIVEYGNSRVEVPFVQAREPGSSEAPFEVLGEGRWGLRMGNKLLTLEDKGDDSLEVRVPSGRVLATMYSATVLDALYQYADLDDPADPEALSLIALLGAIATLIVAIATLWRVVDQASEPPCSKQAEAMCGSGCVASSKTNALGFCDIKCMDNPDCGLPTDLPSEG